MPKLPAVCCRVKSPDSDHVAVLAGQWGDLNYTKSHNLHFLGQHHDFWVIGSKVECCHKATKASRGPQVLPALDFCIQIPRIGASQQMVGPGSLTRRR